MLKTAGTQITSLESIHPIDVSLVRHGANLQKRFSVTKSIREETQMSDNEILNAVLDTEQDGEKQVDEILKAAGCDDEKVKAAAKAMYRLGAAYKKEMPKGLLAHLKKISGMEPDDEDEEGDTEEKGKMKKAAVEFETVIKAQNDQIDVLKKSLKQVTDNAELLSWTAKAEKELRHYPGKTFSEMGAMLKAIAEVDAKQSQAMFDTMKVASDAMAKAIVPASDLAMKAEQPNSAFGKLQAFANGLVEKSASDAKPMTPAAAFVRAVEMKPELYEAYLNEHPAQLYGSPNGEAHKE